MTMPTTAVTTRRETQLARPLSVLVPLIKDDLKKAREAGVGYYRAAGEKMFEAKVQLKRKADFADWIKRNFGIGIGHAQNYMGLVAAENGEAKFASLEQYRRSISKKGRVPGSQRDKDWTNPIKDVLRKVDIETLRREALQKAEEMRAEHALAMQLIDIGFKALSVRLHPDKGGSKEAMARLNKVRKALQQFVA